MSCASTNRAREVALAIDSCESDALLAAEAETGGSKGLRCPPVSSARLLTLALMAFAIALLLQRDSLALVLTVLNISAAAIMITARLAHRGPDARPQAPHATAPPSPPQAPPEPEGGLSTRPRRPGRKRAAAERSASAPPQTAAKRQRYALATITPSGPNGDLPGSMVCYGAPSTTDQRADASMSDEMVPYEAPPGLELDSAEQSPSIECPVCHQLIGAEKLTQRKRNSALAEHLNSEHDGAHDHEEIARLIEREELFRCRFCYLLFGYKATHHEMVKCRRNPDPMPAGQYEINSSVRNADSRLRYKRQSGGCASFALTSAPRGRGPTTPAVLLLTHRN